MLAILSVDRSEPRTFSRDLLRAILRRRIRDVLKQVQSEYDLLVFGRNRVAAHLVGREPELRLKADRR